MGGGTGAGAGAGHEVTGTDERDPRVSQAVCPSQTDRTQASGRPRSSFLGDVAKLTTGTVVAQGLVALASPLVTRLYGPAAFGALALFTSATSIIGVIACLRYELAILLPEDDHDAASLLGVSLLSAAGIAALLSPVAELVRPFAARQSSLSGLVPYLRVLPVAVLATGTFQALNYWNSRTKRFSRLSVAKVANAVATVAIQLVFAAVGLRSGTGLIGAYAGGWVASSFALGFQTWRDDRASLRGVRWQRMAEGLRRYSKFPLVSTWAGLLNSVSWQLPSFMLAYYFSETVVGYYSLGNYVLRVPMSLVGSAIGQVFFQRASEARGGGDLRHVVESSFRRLVRFGMFPILMTTVIGAELFVVIFGPEWLEAGYYVQILSVWTFFWFISSPLNSLFNVLEQQERSLRINIAIFLTRFAALAVGGAVDSPRTALVLFGLSGVVVYGSYNASILRAAGVPLKAAGRVLLEHLLHVLPAWAVLGAIKALRAPAVLTVGVGAIMIVSYVAYVALTDDELAPVLRRARGRLGRVRDLPRV
jgi:lipopolysaccharide exporter